MSTDQRNHVQYRNDVFLPWVESTREHYLRREGWKCGDDVDDDNWWVGCQDGHGPSLKAITDNDQMNFGGDNKSVSC